MGKRESDTTREEREEIARFLYERLHDGKLQPDSMAAAATRFSLHCNTIGIIWSRRANLDGKRDRVGRKKKYVVADVKKAMEAIETRLRQTIRATAAEIGMPKSSFADFLQNDEIRRVNTRIHPQLSNINKIQRLDFILKFISPEPPLRFHGFYDYVHIDEKWLFIDKDRKTYYVTDNEKAPHRAARSKRFLTKVIFLVAATRPRFDTSRNQWLTGTPVTVPVIVDRVVVRHMLINQVIPAIKRVWPARNKRISLQQDNAGPHCLLDNTEVAEVGKQDGWDISLVAQPPSSPDLNVLDLGYFASLQALQQTKKMTSIKDVIRAVEQSYNELGIVALDNVFVTLVGVMEQCLLNSGGDEFSVPHLKKQRRKKGDKLVTLECSTEALSCGILARYLETLREIFE